MDYSKKKKFIGDMARDLDKLKRIPKINYFKAQFLCCNKELRNYKRMLDKS